MEREYIDFKRYLQEELEKDNPNKYRVANERFLDEMTNNSVIVQQLSGTTTKYSAVIPYQIDVITTDVDDTLNYFTKFVKEHNQTTFEQMVLVDNGKYAKNNVKQTYNTPTIIEKDIEILNDHYARIVIFAQMFVLFNSSNIETITIDGENIDFQNGSLSYVSELKSIKKSDRQLNKNMGISSAISLTFIVASQNGFFAKEQHKLRVGERKRNQPFVVELGFSDGITETYNMIIQSASFSFSKSATPSYQISMMEYEE